MIAAINGPVTVHSEYVLLCDIVGEIRGRYFLLSGQKLSAAQAKEYGAVNEVVSRETLLPRAWELARHMNKQSALTLRYTRMALSTRSRRRLQEGLSYGLALEGISAAQVAWLNAQKAKDKTLGG
jgi:enoyl-CoA hydratase/carnithine racemase